MYKIATHYNSLILTISYIIMISSFTLNKFQNLTTLVKCKRFHTVDSSKNWGNLFLPFIEPMFIILPLECRIIGRNFFITLMVPCRLTLTILVMSFCAIISGVPTKHTPALFTTPHNSVKHQSHHALVNNTLIHTFCLQLNLFYIYVIYSSWYVSVIYNTNYTIIAFICFANLIMRYSYLLWCFP